MQLPGGQARCLREVLGVRVQFSRLVRIPNSLSIAFARLLVGDQQRLLAHRTYAARATDPAYEDIISGTGSKF